MADAFCGEIRILPYSFPPQDWAWCNGSTLSIQQSQLLYAIIGNRYGGTQNQTFNLPNMQGTVPIGMGQGPGLTNRNLTSTSVAIVGDNAVTINSNQIANHTHTVTAKLITGTAGSAYSSMTANPAADSWLSRAVLVASSGTSAGSIINFTAGGTPDTTFPAQTISPGGGSAAAVTAHENRQPFMPMNFCICILGEYPVRPS